MIAQTLAFGLPGYQEMVIILIVGLLIFGRRLPEVGKSVGKTIIEFRKGLQSLKDQIREDEDFKEIGSAARDLRSAVDDAATVPRQLGDPAQFLDSLTDEDAASLGPDDENSSSDVDKPPPEQL